MVKLNKIKAYSLLETLIVMAIFVIVVAVFLPLSLNQLRDNRADAAASEMASQLQKYQQRAYTNDGGTNYGISFGTDTYTLFLGDSLATASEITVTEIPSPTEIIQINLADSSSEVVFQQGSLMPSTAGTIKVSDGAYEYDMVINSQGLIYVNQL